MHYFRSRGLAGFRGSLPWTREVCSRDFEEVSDDGL
jgi:hypothetical protein